MYATDSLVNRGMMGYGFFNDYHTSSNIKD